MADEEELDDIRAPTEPKEKEISLRDLMGVSEVFAGSELPNHEHKAGGEFEFKTGEIKLDFTVRLPDV